MLQHATDFGLRHHI